MNLHLSLEARNVNAKEKSLFSWQPQVAIGSNISLGDWGDFKLKRRRVVDIRS